MSKWRLEEIKSNSATVTKLVSGRTGIFPPSLPEHTAWPNHSHALFLSDAPGLPGTGDGLWTVKSLSRVCIKVTQRIRKAYRLRQSSRSSSSHFYPDQRFPPQQSRERVSQPVLELFLSEKTKMVNGHGDDHIYE